MRSRLTTAIGRLVRSATRRPPKPPAPPAKRKPPPGSAAGPVQFEYSPEIDGDPDPGEVVWAWVAYEDDPSQGKDRPVVIVGRRGRQPIGVALTSKRREGTGAAEQFPVGTGSWDRERRPSYAKIDRLIDVDPQAMRREGAILDRRRFDELVAAVRALHAT